MKLVNNYRKFVMTRGNGRKCVKLRPGDIALGYTDPCGTARRSKREESSSKGSTLTVGRKLREESVHLQPDV